MARCDRVSVTLRCDDENEQLTINQLQFHVDMIGPADFTDYSAAIRFEDAQGGEIPSG